MNAGQLFEAQVNNVLYVFWQRATEDELSIYIRKKKKTRRYDLGYLLLRYF